MWDVAPSRRTTVMISAAQWTKLLVARDGRVFGDRASAARAGVAGRNSRPRDINYAANYSAPAGRPRCEGAGGDGTARRPPVRLRSPVPARSQTITGKHDVRAVADQYRSPAEDLSRSPTPRSDPQSSNARRTHSDLQILTIFIHREIRYQRWINRNDR